MSGLVSGHDAPKGGPSGLPSTATATVAPDGPHRACQVTALTRPIHPQGRPQPTPDPDATGPPAGPRVLVAGDDPTNRQIAQFLLERLGCVAELAADGIEVLRRLDEARFDLVLIDVQLEGLDGPGVTREIRRREAEGWTPGGGRGDGPARLPIIAMIAGASEGDRRRCLAAQMDDHLTKPVTLDRLAGVLGRWAPRTGVATIPAVPPAGAIPTPPDLRRERVEEVAQGDAEFERDFLECLLSDVATGLDRLEAALVPFDAAQVANLLHGVVGACRTAGADALGRAARAAEDQARVPGFVPGPDWLAPVREASDRLAVAVAAHLGRPLA